MGTHPKKISDKGHSEQPGADSLEQGLRNLARIIAVQHTKRKRSKPYPECEQQRQIGQMGLKRGNNDS